MSALRIALTELRRITAGRLPRIAVLALMSCRRCTAGCTSTPTTTLTPQRIVYRQPLSSKTSAPSSTVTAPTSGARWPTTWSSARTLTGNASRRPRPRRGVRDGRYDFALTIPRDFCCRAHELRSASSPSRRSCGSPPTTPTPTSPPPSPPTSRARCARRSPTGSASRPPASSSWASATCARVWWTRAKAPDGCPAAHDGTRRRPQLRQGAGRLTGRRPRRRYPRLRRVGPLDSRSRDLPAQTRQLAAGARQVADGDAAIATKGASSRLPPAGSDPLRRGAYPAAADDRDQGLTEVQQQQALRVYDAAGPPVRERGHPVRATPSARPLATGADQVADGTSGWPTPSPGSSSGIGRRAPARTRSRSGRAPAAPAAPRTRHRPDRLPQRRNQLGTG